MIKQYIVGLRGVLLLAALNSALWMVLHAFIPETVTSILLNVVRTSLFVWAGWLVVTEGIGGLWGAAFAGALVFLVDHPIVGGSYFLVTGAPEAFVGVMISFLVFVWAAMLIGWLGGLAGTKRADFKG